MRKNLIKHDGSSGPEDAELEKFQAALKVVAARTGARDVDFSGTPISVFKTHAAAILRRIKAGSIEVVTQNGVPFVILSADQISALLANRGETRMAHELLAGLPSVSASPSVPRHTSSPLRDSHHRVPGRDDA
ncbi:hypothetical protein [Ralstonia pseudosolanacearum]|uniref:hypothetical protein n=1 Tax=Ralstonia pseudosolanacearum TaxID=1310165 RepID=UPI0011B77712|nr:hypothetical protein [Ralstonia pseudosolanacearum]